MRIVVLSDTHAPRLWKRCPPGVAEHLFRAEVIMAAGEVCVPSVLKELSACAPGHAALGTTTVPTSARGEPAKPPNLTWPGLGIGMIHDAGPRQGRPARLRRRFPGIDLVAFAHSHIPLRHSTVIFGSSTPAHPPTTGASLRLDLATDRGLRPRPACLARSRARLSSMPDQPLLEAGGSVIDSRRVAAPF